MTHRAAVTLIEVVLAMGLIAIGVVAVAMTVPASLRLQERARFQLYASAKALELVDRFLGESPVTSLGGSHALEASRPWNVPMGRRNFDPDLELRNAVHRGSVFPLPRDIAYRLDSPYDEIRRILDAGGQLYYSNPVSAHPLKGDNPLQPRPPNEAIRLVVGVVGDPQQNAIQHYPWKGWPYHVAYPSPPSMLGYFDWEQSAGNHTTNMCKAQYRGTELFEYNLYDLTGDGLVDNDEDLVLAWDTDLRSTPHEPDKAPPLSPPDRFDFDGNPPTWWWPRRSGFRNIVSKSMFTATNQNNSSDDEVRYREWTQGAGWNQAKGQLMLALWYGWRRGLPASALMGRATQSDIVAISQDPRQVRAMRYLAFAGATMTRWFALDAEPAQTLTIRDRDYWFNLIAPRTVVRAPHDGLRAGILLPGDDDDPDIQGRVWPMDPCPTLYEVLNGSGLPDGPMPNPFDPASLDAVPAGHPALAGGRAAHFTGAAGQIGHLAVTVAMIQNWHETCLAAGMRHATINPYDWSEPRPLNRHLFTDHPLIQWDILAPSTDQLTTDANGILGTAGDAILGANGPVPARMWRPIAGRPITNMGRIVIAQKSSESTVSISNSRYDLGRDAGANYDSIKGDESRFNLALPFHPTERCRQMVFWAVDWTAYEDWETAMSAPVDAARYPRRHQTDPNKDFTQNIRLEWFDNGVASADRGIYENRTPLYRNPEKSRNYILDMSSMPTGASSLFYTVGGDHGFDYNHTEGAAYAFRAAVGTSWFLRGDMFAANSSYPATLASTPTLPNHPYHVFTGRFGADRNGNGRLDRGPLPASVRLRAVEVARFNYYDPRLGFSLR